MQRLSGILRYLALGLLMLGSVGMLVSMLLGVADVVGTEFLGRPVPGALEVTESTMVLIVFGALAYAQQKRAHIRVELLYGVLGPRAKSFMDVTTHAVALVYFSLLAWQAVGELGYSWEMREATMGTIRFPLYPARFFLLAGAALLLLQLALDLILDLARMRRGEPPPTSPHNPGPTGAESPQVR